MDYDKIEKEKFSFIQYKKGKLFTSAPKQEWRSFDARESMPRISIPTIKTALKNPTKKTNNIYGYKIKVRQAKFEPNKSKNHNSTNTHPFLNSLLNLSHPFQAKTPCPPPKKPERSLRKVIKTPGSSLATYVNVSLKKRSRNHTLQKRDESPWERPHYLASWMNNVFIDIDLFPEA
jgi:hypothetical protein